MIRKALTWLASKTKEIVQLPEFKMTMEVETTIVPRIQQATIVVSIRKNVGSIYRPYIECLEKRISRPNYFEDLIGLTFEKKVERTKAKLQRKAIKRIRKGKTRESDIFNEIRCRQDEFFANAA